jgi:hypothetical protein
VKVFSNWTKERERGEEIEGANVGRHLAEVGCNRGRWASKREVQENAGRECRSEQMCSETVQRSDSALWMVWAKIAKYIPIKERFARAHRIPAEKNSRQIVRVQHWHDVQRREPTSVGKSVGKVHKPKYGRVGNTCKMRLKRVVRTRQIAAILTKFWRQNVVRGQVYNVQKKHKRSGHGQFCQLTLPNNSHKIGAKTDQTETNKTGRVKVSQTAEHLFRLIENR